VSSLRPTTAVVWGAASRGPIQSGWATSQKPTRPSATMPSARAMARILTPGRAHRPDTIPPMIVHDHDRSTAAARSRPVLVVALALTGTMMVVEFVAGRWTGSLALLAAPGGTLRPAWPRSGGGREGLTVRAAYVEVLGDALSSVAALVAAGVMVTTGWTGADPLASAAIVLLIVPRTWSLLRQAVNVLLEG